MGCGRHLLTCCIAGGVHGGIPFVLFFLSGIFLDFGVVSCQLSGVVVVDFSVAVGCFVENILPTSFSTGLSGV